MAESDDAPRAAFTALLSPPPPPSFIESKFTSRVDYDEWLAAQIVTPMKKLSVSKVMPTHARLGGPRGAGAGACRSAAHHLFR